jgi:hypothetical protein
MGNDMQIPMELCSHCKLISLLFVFQVTLLHKFKKYNLVEPDEIRRLGKRFRKLDLDGSGSLSVEEFMNIPDLQQNPLVQRVIDIFDVDRNGEVDFRGNSKLKSK